MKPPVTALLPISPATSLPCKRSPKLLHLPPPTPLTRSGSSWYIHIPGFLRPADRSVFERVWETHPKSFHPIRVYGHDTVENRYSRLYVTDESVGDAYRYSGTSKPCLVCNKSLEEENFVLNVCDMADQLLSLMEDAGHVKIPDDIQAEQRLISIVDEENKEIAQAPRSRRLYNCSLTNWYKPEHSIGLHADDEMRMDNRVPILSLSWGAPRRFLLRPKKGTVDFLSKTAEIMLRDGDLFIMGGACQEEFKHEIPKLRKKDGVGGNRISWTIRRMVPKDVCPKRKRPVSDTEDIVKARKLNRAPA